MKSGKKPERGKRKALLQRKSSFSLHVPGGRGLTHSHAARKGEKRLQTPAREKKKILRAEKPEISQKGRRRGNCEKRSEMLLIWEPSCEKKGRST